MHQPSDLAAAAAAKSLQSCPTLCDPRDGSPPGSVVPGILQARTLEWVAISFSNAWKREVAQILLSANSTKCETSRIFQKNYLLSRECDKMEMCSNTSYRSQESIISAKHSSQLGTFPDLMVCIFLLLTNIWEFPSHFSPGLEIQQNEFLYDFIFCNSRL